MFLLSQIFAMISVVMRCHIADIAMCEILNSSLYDIKEYPVCLADAVTILSAIYALTTCIVW